MKVLTDNFKNALLVKQAKARLNYGELSKITGVNRVTLSNIINLCHRWWQVRRILV